MVADVVPEPVPTRPNSQQRTTTPIPQIADADRDGVADENDQCANSTRGYPVTGSGCAVFGGLVPELEFDGRTATLVPSAFVTLDEMARVLLQFSAVKIELVSHTDQSGSETEQSELTSQRLRTIGRYLVGKGVAQDRLLLRSFGGKRPAHSNSTEQGRQDNNRIEVFENP